MPVQFPVKILFILNTTSNSIAKETAISVSSSLMNTSNENRRLSPAAFPLIAILFLATGASGLIYQVVWQRYFLNTFGATIYSVSAVLSSFMGGLALGSLIFGRLADKMRRPLAAYGLIEIAVAAAALAVPFLLGLMEPVFTWAYREFGSEFFAYSLVRFAFVFVILLIPTTLMGATLPILSRFITSNQTALAGGRVGLLYAVNTAGAVLGAFVCGFYLIRWLGVSNTVLVAAALNLVAGIASLILSVAFEKRSSYAVAPVIPRTAEEIAPATKGLGALILLAYGISGFAALSLEVVWSRSLVFTFENLKNTTYSFTMMLTTFLIGIALGSAVMTPFANKLRHPVRAFAILQVIVGLLSAVSFFALYYLAYNFGNDWLKELDNRPGDIRWNAAVMLVFLKSALVVGPATFCMGLAFPVAVRAVVSANKGVGSTVGRLYAVNTLGAILGAAATGFFLLPWLGIANTIALMGALQMIMGIWIMFREPSVDRHRRVTWAVLAGAALAIILFRTPRPAVFEDITPIEKLVFYEEGPLATVSVIENSLQYRTISVDNVGVAGTDPMLLTDQKSLAHVPMLLLPDPKSALTVGFGSGGASYSYTLYPQLKQIDCVEITPTVPQAAPYLQDSNKGIIYKLNDDAVAAEQKLIGNVPFEQAIKNPQMVNPISDSRLGGDWYKSDPRYNIVLDDARSYLRFTDHLYDVVATDCTDLRYKSNANLYDLEYFTLCRDRITSDGMVVVWMPLAGLSDAAMKVALRTFYAVFPNMEVFFMNNQPTHYVLLLGTKSPLQVDVDRLDERLAIPGVADDLAEIYLNSGEKILSCFVTGRENMGKYLADSPVQELNTEDFPYLEFESPRYGYSDDPILDNLDELYKYRNDVTHLIADAEAHPEFVQSLNRYMQAVPHIIRGHRLYRELDILGACAEYMVAQKINPADTSVADLLNFEEVRRKIRGQVGSTWARYILGKALAMQGRNSEAVTELNEMLTASRQSGADQDPNMKQFRKDALLTLADIYGKEGLTDKAAEYRRQAEQL